mmetsp:Transcript_49015/g.41424  ORF Transcript_49015/g.41424 Transcript_49015/m.41424 type:complete len:296 (-) Transcript_49015:569-1456(-)
MQHTQHTQHTQQTCTNILQHTYTNTATRWHGTPSALLVSQQAATDCNRLQLFCAIFLVSQHAATYYNTLLHTATHLRSTPHLLALVHPHLSFQHTHTHTHIHALSLFPHPTFLHPTSLPSSHLISKALVTPHPRPTTCSVAQTAGNELPNTTHSNTQQHTAARIQLQHIGTAGGRSEVACFTCRSPSCATLCRTAALRCLELFASWFRSVARDYPAPCPHSYGYGARDRTIPRMSTQHQPCEPKCRGLSLGEGEKCLQPPCSSLRPLDPFRSSRTFAWSAGCRCAETGRVRPTRH